MHTIALDTIHYDVGLSKPNFKSGFRYLKPKWHIAPQPSWQPCICKKGCHNTCNSYIFSDKKKVISTPPIKSSCLHAEMQTERLTSICGSAMNIVTTTSSEIPSD
jgi:hypothetical protein